MARIKEIEERLKRWQTWYFTVAQAGAVKSPRMCVKVDGVPVAMAPIAAGTEEALETDRAVAKLPSDLKAIIKVVYLDREGRTMDVNAKILKISRVTLYRKLELADRYLSEYLNIDTDFKDFL